MLMPIFSFQLNNKILPRKFNVGKFNGKQSYLVGATVGDKVLIHCPQDRNPLAQQLDGNISFLNVGQVVTSLTSGLLDEHLGKDILVVGTNTNIIAYDIEKNIDLFYQEIPDGAHAITIGKWGDIPEQLTIVGGNCSIHGFNSKCEDILWTVTGDNVSSLALFDFNSDGYNELVVGSEDYDIRVFREDRLIASMQELETVVSICPLMNTRFAYALSNGTIGMYDRSVRHWRTKSRHMPVVLQTFDYYNKGVDQLVIGWNNGKIEIRDSYTSEVLFKDHHKSAIAGVVKADYRVKGEDALICCTNEGEVLGYKFSPENAAVAVANIHKNSQEAIRDLLQKKQVLLTEISNFEQGTKVNKGISDDQAEQLDVTGDIPAETSIYTMISVEKAEEHFPGHVSVKMTTSNRKIEKYYARLDHDFPLDNTFLSETVIRAVITFAEGLFQGECFVVHPAAFRVCNNITVPIILPRDAPGDLNFQIFVGLRGSSLFHVFNLNRSLPRFSMYIMVENTPGNEPKGYVTFSINERVPRVLAWMNHNFLFSEEYTSNKESLHVTFYCVRTDSFLVIKMQETGQVRIHTDDIELAGNIVQSMGTFLKIEDLQTFGDFPQEFETVHEVFSQIEEYKIVRQKVSSSMAEHSNIIRSFLVRAEDARLMGEISIMKQYYVDLINLNRDLINGYQIRSTNHEELMKCLRFLNQIVEKAGNLRIGNYRTITVKHCRTAISDRNVMLLIKVIKTGNV